MFACWWFCYIVNQQLVAINSLCVPATNSHNPPGPPPPLPSRILPPPNLLTTTQTTKTGNHPNAGEGLWGSSEEVPTFLYAMPLGGNRVFLEETCLVAKPALPFAVLKRRLQRRLDAMGVKVKKVGVSVWV